MLSVLILFLILALVNPLVSHNGVTVLFVLNDNPVTLESLLYGLNSSVMITAVLYWLNSFSQIMTSEKLLCVFGAISPKIALILSMTLRFVPLLNSQTKKVSDAQKALGFYKSDNIIDSLHEKMRVFNIVLTWALENGIITDGSYEGSGCAISQASADMMLDLVIGKDIKEAQELADIFMRMIKETVTEEELERLEEASSLQDISHMPSRVKCAVLGWRTLNEIIEKNLS